MRKSFPFLATAALLVALSPAYAANPSNSDTGKTVLHKDDRATVGPVSPAGMDDSKANVILLDQNSLQALPNPYANPGPRMISDVWAMRT